MSLNVAVDSIVDADRIKEQSTLATAEQDLSINDTSEDAINGLPMNITDCANTTYRSSSGVLDAIIDSSQLVDSIAHEPPGHASEAESVTVNRGIGPDRRLDSGVTDMGDGCSHYTSEALIPRRSDCVLAKSTVVQDIGRVLVNASSIPGRRGRKRGGRHRRPVEKEASCATAVQIPEPLHVDHLKILASRLPATLSTHTSDVSAQPPAGLKRKRAASLPLDTLCSYGPEKDGVAILGLDMHVNVSCVSQMFPLSSYGHDEDFLAQARMEVNKRAEEGLEHRGV